jgi:hypothetical protein
VRFALNGSAYPYLLDAIDLFEENNWDWSCHAFRESSAWSVELGEDRYDLTPPSQPTNRELLLRDWFIANSEPFNLLTNHSFEWDLEGNNVADGWSATGGTIPALSLDTIKYGFYSQKFETTGYGSGLRQDWISVSPSTTYTLSAWIKVEQGQVNMCDYETNAAWQVIGSKGSKLVGPSDWAYHSVTFTTDPNATLLSVRFFGWDNSTTIAYIDGVKLEKCTE